jgi:hypothetical protein
MADMSISSLVARIRAAFPVEPQPYDGPCQLRGPGCEGMGWRLDGIVACIDCGADELLGEGWI